MDIKPQPLFWLILIANQRKHIKDVTKIKLEVNIVELTKSLQTKILVCEIICGNFVQCNVTKIIKNYT